MSAYTLSPQSIADACEEISFSLGTVGLDRKEIIKTSLIAEEVLVKYAEKFGEDITAEINVRKFFGNPRVQIDIKCPKMDPFEKEEEGEILKSFLIGAESRNRWRYFGDTNTVTLMREKTKKISNLLKVLIGLCGGIALGFLMRALLGAESYGLIISDYISPITNTFTGLLCVMAILLVFFSFPLQIVQLDGTSGFKRIASGLLIPYGIIGFGVIVLIFALISPFLSLNFSAAAGPKILKSGLDVVLGFIPTNLVTPFMNFNCLQVVIIGIMFGFSFLAMGESAAPIIKVFDNCNLVAVLTNNYLNKFIPVYVALMGFTAASVEFGSSAGLFLRIALITVAAALLLVIGFFIVICTKFKVKPGLLWKKFAECFVVGLSSASLGASFIDLFNEMVECGMDVLYTGVVANTGTVLFKPVYGAFLAVSALCVASYEGLAVSAVWLVLVAILAFLLTLSIPNIPGGAASAIMLLFGILGVSSGTANMVVSINAILQFIIVPANMLLLQLHGILAADRQGKLDVEKLRAPKAN